MGLTVVFIQGGDTEENSGSSICRDTIKGKGMNIIFVLSRTIKVTKDFALRICCN